MTGRRCRGGGRAGGPAAVLLVAALLGGCSGKLPVESAAAAPRPAVTAAAPASAGPASTAAAAAAATMSTGPTAPTAAEQAATAAAGQAAAARAVTDRVAGQQEAAARRAAAAEAARVVAAKKAAQAKAARIRAAKRLEADVARLPSGISSAAVFGAERDGWSADASKRTGRLYLLRRSSKTGHVVVSLRSPTSFGGCNSDGCFTTPNGVFNVIRKGGADHRSNQWKMANGLGSVMAWPVFFHGGVAIHYDPLGASHECVHVPSMADAKNIHDHLPIGARVVVH